VERLFKKRADKQKERASSVAAISWEKSPDATAAAAYFDIAVVMGASSYVVVRSTVEIQANLDTADSCQSASMVDNYSLLREGSDQVMRESQPYSSSAVYRAA